MPRLKMQWKARTKQRVAVLWLSGEWAIELSDLGYELYEGATYVRTFPSLEDAKRHAHSLAYIASERSHAPSS